MEASPFRIPEHLASVPGYREHQAFIYSGMGNGSGRHRNPIGDSSCKQRLLNSRFRHAEFSEFTSSGSYFRSSRFIDTKFSSCKFTETVFSECEFADFRACPVFAFGCNFENVSFKNSLIHGSSFRKSNFQRSYFRESVIRNSEFTGSDARASWILGGSVGDTWFSFLDFRNAHLHSVFENDNFENSDMSFVDFAKSVMSNCGFLEVNLTGATFQNAVLNGEMQRHVPGFNQKVKDMFSSACRASKKVISFSLLRAQCVNRVCRELGLVTPNKADCEFSSAGLAYGMFSGLAKVPELRLSNWEVVEQVDRFSFIELLGSSSRK